MSFRTGHHLLRGGPHIRVWPAHALTDGLIDEIKRAVILGDDRTLSQDIEFAVRQLVEVAMRALSPGINDPFTAIAVIDRLAESFEIYLERPEARKTWTDDAGNTCLTVPSSDFASIAAGAFNPIRQAATGLPIVLIHLLDAVRRLLERATTDEQRKALEANAKLIVEAGARSFSEPQDQAKLASGLPAVDLNLNSESNKHK